MKKNLRKIPPSISAKLKRVNGGLIAVGCAKKFSRQDIEAGDLQHLGVVMQPSGLDLPTAVVPSASQGKYSDRNVNGEVIVRKDLPKETHYRNIEVPDWGDWSNGSHEVEIPYEAYPREFKPPRELEIAMECLNKDPGLAEYVISFQVREVLERGAKDFEKRLLEDLNLLQENIGACGVEPSTAALKDYVKSLHVSWDILPPGTKSTVLQRLFRGRSPSQQQVDVADKRYGFFEQLNPKKLIIGTSGFRRYFGALIEDDLVVFENIEYGNAVYILFGDWERLSQKSRVELISGVYGSDFERVIHGDGWENRVREIIKKKRGTNT